MSHPALLEAIEETCKEIRATSRLIFVRASRRIAEESGEIVAVKDTEDDDREETKRLPGPNGN